MKTIYKHLALVIFIFIVSSSNIFAAGSLSELSDVISNETPLDYAGHSIHFTLPTNSQPIHTSDYIQIYLAYFTNISPPFFMTGQYAGTPQFSVSGQYARVTNITVVAGSTISIEGMYARNPDDYNKYQVMVMITQDEEGLIVKNIGNVIASSYVGNVGVSAQIDEPQGRLVISGYTSPGTYVLFTEADQIIGTDVSSYIGYFSQTFPALMVGSHLINLYGIDLDNFVTSFLPVSVYVSDRQQISIFNLLLSPTLYMEDVSINQTDPIIATGSAAPGAAISVFTDAPLRTYYASAAADGRWNYTIDNSDEYVPGDYRLYTMAQSTSGMQSTFSNSIGFTIYPAGGPVGSPCGDISNGDLNCDDSIDITDFSILMYYWGTANSTADINGDNFVNIIDFSIQMYWWGT